MPKTPEKPKTPVFCRGVDNNLKEQDKLEKKGFTPEELKQAGYSEQEIKEILQEQL